MRPCHFSCIEAFTFILSFIHLQIDSDDVITRDEQIYVVIGAHAKCERTIQAQKALVKGSCAALDHVCIKSQDRMVFHFV